MLKAAGLEITGGEGGWKRGPSPLPFQSRSVGTMRRNLRRGGQGSGRALEESSAQRLAVEVLLEAEKW